MLLSCDKKWIYACSECVGESSVPVGSRWHATTVDSISPAIPLPCARGVLRRPAHRVDGRRRHPPALPGTVGYLPAGTLWLCALVAQGIEQRFLIRCVRDECSSLTWDYFSCGRQEPVANYGMCARWSHCLRHPCDSRTVRGPFRGHTSRSSPSRPRRLTSRRVQTSRRVAIGTADGVVVAWGAATRAFQSKERLAQHHRPGGAAQRGPATRRVRQPHLFSRPSSTGCVHLHGPTASPSVSSRRTSCIMAGRRLGPRLNRAPRMR
jgi:hypothetical protein